MGLSAVAISFLILGIAILIQTTILDWISIGGVIPDLSLIILIFIAHRRGSMTGQVSGFFTGLIQDFLSLSPLGFHALIKTILGYLYGLVTKNLFVDPIFTPMILVAIGTLVKGLLAALTGTLLSIPSASFAYFTGKLWIELGYNIILAPFFFALMGRIFVYRKRDRDEETS